MKNKLLLVFSAALILRLALAFSAYHGDLNNNISWGTLATQRGLVNFYGSDNANDWPYSAPNQPPLSLLMFTGLRVVWQSIENVSWSLNENISVFPSKFIWFWESKGMMFLVKLPGMLADLGMAWLIYQYIRKQDKKSQAKEKAAIFLATIWLFNPVTWYNSAIWGQTDSVVNLLGFMGILALLKKRLTRFSAFFTLSFLFKGSLGIFIPILIFIAIRQKHSFQDWLKSTACSLVIIALISIWFHPQLDLFFWLIELYKDRILPGEIGYLTANAFNFWWLIDSGKILDNTVFIGLPARLWGVIISLTGIGAIIFWLKGKITDKKIFYSLSVVSLITFLFMTRIHERYLYPFFPYAIMLLGLIPGFVIGYVILSATHILNLYHLFWAPSIPVLESFYKFPWFAEVLSLINILVLFYFLRLLRSTKI